jgi:hypothetical protein
MCIAMKGAARNQSIRSPAIRSAGAGGERVLEDVLHFPTRADFGRRDAPHDE